VEDKKTVVGGHGAGKAVVAGDLAAVWAGVCRVCGADVDHKALASGMFTCSARPAGKLSRDRSRPTTELNLRRRLGSGHFPAPIAEQSHGQPTPRAAGRDAFCV
jgi:hypothetical protein